MLCDLMGGFSEAGKRMQQAMVEWKIIDKYANQLEQVKNPQTEQYLLEKLAEADARWDKLHGYEVFEDKGELQYRCIRAQDYDDRISDDLSRFYACPHCGTYFFSKFWVRRFHRWYCELDFAKWRQLADSADVDRLKQAWGDNPTKWPMVGCGKLYTPWAHGPGMVIEYKDGCGGWQAFRATSFLRSWMTASRRSRWSSTRLPPA